MIAILIFGLWLGDRVNRAREQRLAVAAVKADNGFVRYADEFKMGPVNVPAGNAIWKPSWGTLVPKKGPTKPGLIQSWLGDEYVREVVHVSLYVDIEKGIAGAPNNLARPLDDVLWELRTQRGIKTLHLGGEKWGAPAELERAERDRRRTRLESDRSAVTEWWQ